PLEALRYGLAVVSWLLIPGRELEFVISVRSEGACRSDVCCHRRAMASGMEGEMKGIPQLRDAFGQNAVVDPGATPVAGHQACRAQQVQVVAGRGGGACGVR